MSIRAFAPKLLFAQHMGRSNHLQLHLQPPWRWHISAPPCTSGGNSFAANTLRLLSVNCWPQPAHKATNFRRARLLLLVLLHNCMNCAAQFPACSASSLSRIGFLKQPRAGWRLNEMKCIHTVEDNLQNCIAFLMFSRAFHLLSAPVFLWQVNNAAVRRTVRFIAIGISIKKRERQEKR